ncbi:hypothetical protein D3C79_950710 [compost metagenome]
MGGARTGQALTRQIIVILLQNRSIDASQTIKAQLCKIEEQTHVQVNGGLSTPRNDLPHLPVLIGLRAGFVFENN